MLLVHQFLESSELFRHLITSRCFRKGFGDFNCERLLTKVLSKLQIPLFPRESPNNVASSPKLRRCRSGAAKPGLRSRPFRRCSNSSANPSWRPPSEATSPPTGARSIPTSNRPPSSSTASVPNAAAAGKKPNSPKCRPKAKCRRMRSGRRGIRSPELLTKRKPCLNCRIGGVGQTWNESIGICDLPLDWTRRR